MAGHRSWVVGLVAGLAAGPWMLGCGGNPVAGHWNAPSAFSGFNANIELNLNGDGSLGETVTGTTNCVGAIVFTAAQWSATSTTLTISGTPECSGSLMCTIEGMNYGVNCTTSGEVGLYRYGGTFSYTLTNRNNSLTITQVAGTDGGVMTGGQAFVRGS